MGLMILGGVAFAENGIYFTKVVVNNDSTSSQAVIRLSSNELDKEDMERLTVMFKKAQDELKANKVVLKIENISQ
jgi:hypothetical protein